MCVLNLTEVKRVSELWARIYFISQVLYEELYKKRVGVFIQHTDFVVEGVCRRATNVYLYTTNQ